MVAVYSLCGQVDVGGLPLDFTLYARLYAAYAQNTTQLVLPLFYRGE